MLLIQITCCTIYYMCSNIHYLFVIALCIFIIIFQGLPHLGLYNMKLTKSNCCFSQPRKNFLNPLVLLRWDFGV